MVKDNSESERGNPLPPHGLLFSRKEENVLFNNVLNTFYLWLYGVEHMIKDHSVRLCYTSRGALDEERTAYIQIPMIKVSKQVLKTEMWRKT